MKMYKCLLIKNKCYILNATSTRRPKGIVVHSTGAENPNLARYVQPCAGQGIGMGWMAEDGTYTSYTEAEIRQKLGRNSYSNDWNQYTPGGRSVCVSAFIGKDASGEVQVCQTLPWGCVVYGSGSGTKGSYNNTHVQFEMCEDDLTDAAYLERVYQKAVELCAYLCEIYGLDTSTIVSHKEAHDLGYGSNHGDPDHWFKRHGKTMDGFRADVKKKLAGTETTAAPATATTTTTAAATAAATTTGGFDMANLATIKNGSKGTTVKRLQQMLNASGYDCGTADGIAGSKTVKGIMQFQSANGLAADGICGQKTWAKLLLG